MGSSASKVSRTAGASARKYPTRPSNVTARSAPPAAPAKPGPTTHPAPQAASQRTEAIDLDARDPVLASRLNSIGAVQPNPHFSPTSTSSLDPQRNPSTTRPSDDFSMPPHSAFPDPRDNPALRVLQARQRIAEKAEDEFTQVGRRGFQGQTYIDAGLIQLALTRKGKGEKHETIEPSLGIRKGRLDVLGKGIVEAI
ncbi:hypothetical protein EJ04DRAFT_429033 [Polyplosphaeria fusca]|uniref:Helix-turn-helix domain-containing protein n=1 Tax=Polyplosphaeria fusca TaxID=682080 RepID=A0A9P4R7V0_9PLEO|nr:hypothetical protein EJ04DRAFT_429033 [Polyplosphaeria fusca]